MLGNRGCVQVPCRGPLRIQGLGPFAGLAVFFTELPVTLAEIGELCVQLQCPTAALGEFGFELTLLLPCSREHPGIILVHRSHCLPQRSVAFLELLRQRPGTFCFHCQQRPIQLQQKRRNSRALPGIGMDVMALTGIEERIHRRDRLYRGAGKLEPQSAGHGVHR